MSLFSFCLVQMSGEWRSGRAGGVFSGAGESGPMHDGAVRPSGEAGCRGIKVKVSIEIEDVQLCRQFKLNNKQEKF